MNTIFSDFKESVGKESLCDLKEFRFDNGKLPDYSNKKHQQLFLLRYFPAYLCEYKYLYKTVITQRKLTEYNVLSIGCGCFLDYYGLYFALAQYPQSIKYTGIDIIDWEYKDTLNNPEIWFHQIKIEDYLFPNAVDYNIIFFPKSISEISNVGFTIFLENLKKVDFTSDYIYLISSTMDKGFGYDEKKYKKIIECLVNIGYNCENYQPPQEFSKKEAFIRFDREFYYPDDIKEYLNKLHEKCSEYVGNNKSCYNECHKMSRAPILTTGYASFLVNVLERS